MKKELNETTQLQGKLVVRSFGKVCKTENDVVYILTNAGPYFLHLIGESSFHSDKLKKLKDKYVVVTGIIRKCIFFANSVIELQSLTGYRPEWK